MRSIAQREDIRDLILDAVEVLLGRFGYRKMTMEDVAREVGIGKGTIYLHFPSKEELILSHVDRIAGRVVTELREIAASPDPADERIRRMLLARVLIRFDGVSRYSRGLGDLLSSVRTALLARREKYFAAEADIFAGVLTDGVRTGLFHCPEPETAARVLIQSTNSLLPFNLSAAELGRREDVERQAADIAALLVGGLTGGRKAPSRH
jgi:AcrR family transcriptional regulator